MTISVLKAGLNMMIIVMSAVMKLITVLNVQMDQNVSCVKRVTS